MATTTTRLGLIEPVTADAPSELRVAITNHATTLDTAALDTQGTAASRPAAATSGRYYESTDAGALDRDNGTAWNNIISAGDLKLSAASVAPSGWLLCDGSAISRTTFAVLFNALGTTYGVGNGSTTFNIPDCRGRTLIGAGAGSGLTARARGDAGGEETHPLTVSELASHNHGAVSGSFVADTAGSTQANPGSGVVAGNNRENVTALTGSGTAHNNMQPYWVANVLIKT